MTLTITLTDGASPSEEIEHQIREEITSGRLGVGTRLPSVRQLAADVGVAAGTVAKAYKRLEADGTVVTSGRGGTRVGERHGAAAQTVVARARELVRAARTEGADLDEAVRVLRAVWDD
ncbi:GntR family transcriptional regulator [Paraoerskovia marina]|uniref:DNA-binding transcriptional regulator YhcF, GntR family n=1 Tax=Paraoerskovia marina TaxID=545619 RepID=A0A1H1MZK5_9CELL|nr:GntR family transcriptional regulator [Paraoerskovia marina]SDR92038.1 DNA-binding transcriptional regulator YhcF, GntR family [Paraoerskovia marina]